MFTYRRIIILAGLLGVVFSFLQTFSFATGNVVGGTIYNKWLEQIFVSLPENLSDSSSNVVVRKSNTLVDGGGVVSMAAGTNGNDVKLFIGNMPMNVNESGINFTVTDASVLIAPDFSNSGVLLSQASSGNPELKIGDTLRHASFYRDVTADTFNIWIGDTHSTGENVAIIDYSNNKISFPEGMSINGDIPVYKDQECAPGGYLKGFDENGAVVCGPLFFYRWYVSDILGECKADSNGLYYQSRKLYCYDQDLNQHDSSLCALNDGERPVTKIPCNL